MDIPKLYSDIRSALTSEAAISSHLNSPPEPRWSVDSDGLLRLDERIYVPDIDDLCLRILQNKHDHPISGHFGQNKTIKLIRREYVWPGLRDFVKSFCKSYTTCL
jgi:hypothetical protein